MVAPYPEQITQALPPPRYPSNYLDKDRITFAELEAAKIIVLNAFENNLSRHKLMADALRAPASMRPPESQAEEYVQNYDDIKKFFLSLYFEGRLHQLFIPVTLQRLSEDIFTNDAIRDFVLNWTDLSMVSLSVQDYSLDNLAETISQGVCQNKPTDGQGAHPLSLVNNKVALSIQLTPEYVKEILQANAWLLCITVLYLFMSDVLASIMG